MANCVLTESRKMSMVRPISVMCEEGVSGDQMVAVTDGIKEILNIAGVRSQIQVNNIGVWRGKDYLKDGTLTQWNSVDWFVKEALHKMPMQDKVDPIRLMTRLQAISWREEQPQYSVIVLRKDLDVTGTGFVIGGGVAGLGAVISVYRFLSLPHDQQLGCINTATLHEVGHAFGLLPKDRKENIVYKLGIHCTNVCVMRQGIQVPEEWVSMTDDRLQHGPFCDTCRRDLQRFFQ